VGGACFVTATDTEVGKTILTATIVAGLRADGVVARARKPVITGVAPRPGRPPAGSDVEIGALPDDELLAAISGEAPEAVSMLRFEPPTSPHLAAATAGLRIDPGEIVASLRAAAAQSGALVVEGIGGLLVPLNDRYDVRRLAAELGWPVVIAARPGLGTINHTLMTLEVARHAGLDVRAVVLTPWPDAPDQIDRSNRETVAALGEVEVHVLPRLAAVTRASLAGAAADLPCASWLG
jgi:dethiobiotin synthetase